MALTNITIDLDGKSIILETGLLGAQANGAVTARCGETIVLATVVSGPSEAGLDYFPLQVEYREKLYASGLISSSRFIKREGKPSDGEVLTSRLIDRSIRPIFPEGYYDQVQVIVTPLSYDGENETATLGIVATSAALCLSDIPFNGPIAAVRVGLGQDGKYLVNPTSAEKKSSSLDLVVSGGTGSIAMVESGANEVTEDQLIEALKFGQKYVDSIIESIKTFTKDIAKLKKVVPEIVTEKGLVKLVKDNVDIEALLQDSKTISGEGINFDTSIELILAKDPEADKAKLIKIIDDSLKAIVRAKVLKDGLRFDGRGAEDIRNISAQVGLLPRAHGSGFFQRGLTHALSVATLGSPSQEQLIDGMYGEETKRFMLHYNMPPFATGEPGRVGAPNRREIGHGALAERAITPVLPSEAEFPYTVRVVTEIMSGNGSTSQASICGSSLALMDAGVPIKKAVAGIAMGLITDGKGKYVTLTDIAGLEDHIGDMDFKVAGTADGVTALQMDVKVPGVSADILGEALGQAKKARLFILGEMAKAISVPRAQISKYAPKIVTLKIDPEKIGEIIGPGGKVIRKLQTDFTVQIDIDDSGLVSITGTAPDGVEGARAYIEGVTTEVEVNKIYEGHVERVESFGAFVSVLPGKSGLVHVSRMGKGSFIADANDVLSVGDIVKVNADEIDDRGRLNLTLVEGGRTPEGGSSPRPRSDSPTSGARPAYRDGRSGDQKVFKRFRDSR